MVAGFCRVTWSVAEIAALATKAARGAGAPPWQAVRFGQATVRHIVAGRSPVSIVAALDALPQGPVMSFPLLTEAALADASGSAVVTCDAPDEAFLESYAEAAPFATSLRRNSSGLTLCAVCSRASDRLPALRLRCDAALIAMLEDLAARTYVPETDQSRQTGAGAAGLDND